MRMSPSKLLPSVVCTMPCAAHKFVIKKNGRARVQRLERVWNILGTLVNGVAIAGRLPALLTPMSARLTLIERDIMVWHGQDHRIHGRAVNFTDGPALIEFVAIPIGHVALDGNIFQ